MYIFNMKNKNVSHFIYIYNNNTIALYIPIIITLILLIPALLFNIIYTN